MLVAQTTTSSKRELVLNCFIDTLPEQRMNKRTLDTYNYKGVSISTDESPCNKTPSIEIGTRRKGREKPKKEQPDKEQGERSNAT